MDMPLYIPDSCIDCLCVSKVCGSLVVAGSSPIRDSSSVSFSTLSALDIALHCCLYNISFIIIIALKDLSFIIKLNCNGNMIVVSLNF